LKRLATDSSYTYTHTVNTDDVQQLFSKAAGTDLSSLFNLYLRTTQKLEIYVRQQDTAKYLIRLYNFDQPLPLDITTNEGTTRRMVDKKGIIVISTTLPVVDAKTFYLKKVVYE
jgi:hypothetical protein